MQGLIKIDKHPILQNNVVAHFNQRALDIIGEKEIVLIEKTGNAFQALIKLQDRPTSYRFPHLA